MHLFTIIKNKDVNESLPGETYPKYGVDYLAVLIVLIKLCL